VPFLTKDQIVEEAKARTLALGGKLAWIGGDCYAALIGDAPPLLLSAKECGVAKLLWVGSPLPLLRALIEGLAFQGREYHPTADRAFIVLAHNPTKTNIVIPIRAAYADILQRARFDHKLRTGFHVRPTGYRKYAIKTDPARPDIPLQNAAEVEAVWSSLVPPAVDGVAVAPPNNDL
jgi:hypothetical protein